MRKKAQTIINAARVQHAGLAVPPWGGQAVNHFKLVFPLGVKFDYFQGLGHKQPPRVDDILASLAQDWRAVKDCDGDETTFLCDFGYNEGPDSMKAGRRIFAKINKNIFKLQGVGIYLPDIEGFIEE